MEALPKPPRQEFERKFLVIVPELPEELPDPKELVQGYLTTDPLQSRIRIVDGKSAVHEFKGRDDFESDACELPLDQARHLLNRYRVGYLVDKLRHVIPAGFDGLEWELDIFRDQNEPLHLVEIEMPSADYPLDMKPFPDWVGEEVTNDRRFKNKYLVMRPFRSWPKRERKEIRHEMGLK